MNFDFNQPLDLTNVSDDGYTLLAPGPARFTVTNGVRKRASSGSWMFQLTLAVTDQNGTRAEVKDNLVLTDKALWKVKSFFGSLGFQTDQITPDMWDACIGRSGGCTIELEDWTGDDGKERQSNRIARYNKPDAAQPATVPATPAPQPPAQAANGWGSGWQQPPAQPVPIEQAYPDLAGIFE